MCSFNTSSVKSTFDLKNLKIDDCVAGWDPQIGGGRGVSPCSLILILNRVCSFVSTEQPDCSTSGCWQKAHLTSAELLGLKEQIRSKLQKGDTCQCRCAEMFELVTSLTPSSVSWQVSLWFPTPVMISLPWSAPQNWFSLWFRAALNDGRCFGRVFWLRVSKISSHR